MIIPSLYNRFFSVRTLAGRRPTPQRFDLHLAKAAVEEVAQIIHDKTELINFNQFVEKTFQLQMTNIIQAAIALLQAQGPTGIVALQATSDGALKVSQAQASLDEYEMLEGSGSDSFVEKTFSQQVSRLDIFIYDNAAVIKIAKDKVSSYGGEIEIWADSFYSIDALIQRVSVKNKTSGSNARFKLVGWYQGS